jgi:hypothetical protein
LLLFLPRLLDRLRELDFPRLLARAVFDPDRRAFEVVFRDFAEDFFFAEEAFVFFRGRDFFNRAFFAGFAAALIFRDALLTVFFAVVATSWSFEAARPASAPRTPPTTAPTGPATLPMTAPVAIPAVCLEIGGISMFSEEPGEGSPPLCCCSSSFGIIQISLLRFYTSRSEEDPQVRVTFQHCEKKSA